LLEAQVQDLLAAVHQHIGTFAFSKAAADRACGLYEAHAGRDDPRTLRAEARVIGAALNLNKTSEAEPMIDALLPRVQRVLGEGDLTTLEVRRAQATVHMLRGRLDESETLYLELLAHPTLTLDDRTQSRILFSLCRLRQRRPFLEDAAQRTEYLRRSEELARQCVDKSHRAAGPGSLDVLRAQVILAQALCDMNRYAETAELTREVLSVSEEKFESCHMVRHTAMSVLADALSGMGEFDEPAALYGRIIACLRASAASDSITFISNLTDGLKYFDRSGRAAEGEAITREGLDVLARFSGSHNDVTLILNSYLAHFISSSGRADEAEPMFEKLLAPIESVSSKQARARFHKFYAAHLVRRGKFKDSEERLGLALSIYGSAVAQARDRVPDEIVCGYVELYKAWNKPDKVREYEQLRLDMFGIPPRS
jgi:tetratricopeptide (TPR) repeat protein